jgi:hypothetical protein
MIGSPFRTTCRAQRPAAPSATRSAATTIHGTCERSLAATGVEAIHSPRTASAGWMAARRPAERVLRGRGETGADATRPTADTARPSTSRRWPAGALITSSSAPTGCAEAARDKCFVFVCLRAGEATVAEPISMPPPEPAPSVLELSATGGAAAGADAVGDSACEAGVGVGFGWLADAGGEGSESDGGAGGVSGAEGGKGAPRGGRSVSGST